MILWVEGPLFAWYILDQIVVFYVFFFSDCFYSTTVEPFEVSNKIPGRTKMQNERTMGTFWVQNTAFKTDWICPLTSILKGLVPRRIRAKMARKEQEEKKRKAAAKTLTIRWITL